MSLNQLSGNNPWLRFLRKPDFQRETNHWSPEQVAQLIRSFATGELIPSLILWKSDTHVFVIDGGHRISALRAWVENDYGSGHLSYDFFNGQIPEDQRKMAEKTKRLVEKNIGRYADFENFSSSNDELDSDESKIASTIFTRSLHVQWIQGSQEVAEASFFKINSQGTSLDATEELLLKNRNKSYAIASRSIVRAGTGHDYSSAFDVNIKDEIKRLSTELNYSLFQPDIKTPIKTLDLPLGGTSSPVDALKILIDIFAIAEGSVNPKKAIEALSDDISREQTIEALKNKAKIVRRMTGNTPGSLGLHPAVYFYNENGKHSRFLFLGILTAFARAVRNNNKQWFKNFTKGRREIEDLLVKRKSLINQGLANIGSAVRIKKVADLMNGLVEKCHKNEKINDSDILTLLGLKGTAGELRIIDAPVGFSDHIKSAIYLRDSLKTALRCNHCGGYLDTTKSTSYDHIDPVRDGGLGEIENGQLLHPFCNTAVKQ